MATPEAFLRAPDPARRAQVGNRAEATGAFSPHPSTSRILRPSRRTSSTALMLPGIATFLVPGRLMNVMLPG